MNQPADRELDLVLVGTTGFVGRLTAAELARRAPASLRIALAGRSAPRLETVRAALPEPARDWPLIIVDVLDEDAVAALAERTRVVVTTVGPYLRYGLPLVRACASAGTHYADLTGETLFVRRSIDLADEPARASGARIVHSCGFDSIPSDLGVGLAARAAAEAGAGELVSVVLHVRRLRGGISGGTIDSLRQQVIESAHDPAARRLAGDRWALVDEPSGRPYGSSGAGRRPRLPVDRDERTGSWQAPFVMGTYNRQIVQRTNALSGWAYGREFRYREVVDTGRGPRGAVMAAGLTLGTGALMAGMALPPSRWLLDRVLPAPGEGPDERQRAAGAFAVELHAATTSGAPFRATVAADHDPGYDGTAVMLAQSGLGLACDADLGAPGVVTPMVALGSSLPQRLRDRGFTVAAEPFEADRHR